MGLEPCLTVFIVFHADSMAGKKKQHQVEPEEAPWEDISSVLVVMKDVMALQVEQQKAHMEEVCALCEAVIEECT